MSCVKKELVATWNGHNWDTVVTTCQGVCRVDVSVARGTKRGSIRFAKKGCRGTLAGFANPYTLVARSHETRCMYAGITARTQIGGIRPTVNGTCCGMATVTHPCPIVTVLFFQHWTNFSFLFSFSLFCVVKNL